MPLVVVAGRGEMDPGPTAFCKLLLENADLLLAVLDPTRQPFVDRVGEHRNDETMSRLSLRFARPSEPDRFPDTTGNAGCLIGQKTERILDPGRERFQDLRADSTAGTDSLVQTRALRVRVTLRVRLRVQDRPRL